MLNFFPYLDLADHTHCCNIGLFGCGYGPVGEINRHMMISLPVVLMKIIPQTKFTNSDPRPYA